MSDFPRDPSDSIDGDQRDELASRLIDDDLGPEEKAAAESDSAVTARVQQMASARRVLAADDPVDSALTDAAVRAALAVAEEIGLVSGAIPQEQSDRTATTPGRVVPFRPRRRWGAALPWLGAAAAAALVVVGVASLSNSDSDSDDLTATKDSAASAAPADTLGPLAAAAPAETEANTGAVADDQGGATPSPGAPADTARAAETSSATEAPGTDAVIFGDSSAATEAPAGTEAPASPPASDPVPSDRTVRLTDAIALRDFAVAAAPVDGQSSCAPDGALLAATAAYGPEGDVQTVEIVITDADGNRIAVAYSLSDCTEVARVPLG